MLTAWRGGAVAGAAPGFAAGVGGLSAEVGQVKMVVADQPRALQPEAPITERGSVMRAAGCQSVATIRSPLRRLISTS